MIRFGRQIGHANMTLKTVAIAVCVVVFCAAVVSAQPAHCDPSKVISAETCARCHGNEVSRWQQTPHFQTFEQLARNPKSKEITDRLGLSSIKRNNLCIQCHFTLKKEEDGRVRPVAGISCESCHGAARDWLAIHNNYGGATGTEDKESSAHRIQRLAESTEFGMRNTQNVYLIAKSCFNCHTIPHEQLVNVGGHPPTSDAFELVAWSQGKIRHNFLRTGGIANATSSIERLRVIYVVGLLADLEFSTRATGRATEQGAYGTAVANRAVRAAVKLFDVQQQINDPSVEQSLTAFAAAELKTNNARQLDEIADRISQAGSDFALKNDGRNLAAVDRWLPSPEKYR